MFSDFIKGKRKFDYPSGVQKGIALHRAIDEFTDNHREVSFCKDFFRPTYRLYSGAIIDILFDHFLANDPNEFQQGELAAFSRSVYRTLEDYIELFPMKFGFMFPFMKEQNWLFNYKNREGIERSLAGLVRRAKYLDDHKPAFRIFESNYEAISNSYKAFFPELKEYASVQLQLLIN
jgi:acyl carrier protein phosphodiesterase